MLDCIAYIPNLYHIAFLNPIKILIVCNQDGIGFKACCGKGCINMLTFWQVPYS